MLVESVFEVFMVACVCAGVLMPMVLCLVFGVGFVSACGWMLFMAVGLGFGLVWVYTCLVFLIGCDGCLLEAFRLLL